MIRLSDGKLSNGHFDTPSAIDFGEDSSTAEKVAILDGFGSLDRRARMLLRRDGTWLAGCSRMTNIINAGSDLVLIDGVIDTVEPKYRDGLKHLLQANSPDVLTLALRCRMPDGHLLLRAVAISDDLVCVVVQRATGIIEPELPDLEQVFHLTKTEAMIVLNLFAGHTPTQIAEDHDNSIHTIRAHIRRCYDKLGVTCREELWRKLNAYRLV
ncbi:helix-turn-helix transcriptional regulator [Pontixanthobacter gangjinensis]|uniref:HTH luxR-type domain-containing protein n=1 Tax=Pontixanthobacter gangjinensis TaxID=1028742 RepID=A0A6I4SRI3_9SPHN|nr:LuxR C-terminal-related transcriptional regulator [Pontixanthobacter gangjinensis]MXO57636.1 hypothetical protein [Pontixanthobacter gangjinensis]